MARVEAAVLANPGMSARALAKKLGVGKTTVLRVRERKFLPGPRSTVEMARVEVPQPQARSSSIVAVEPEPRPSNIARAADARTALGQFAPGPRPQPLMDKARAALAAHPEMSATAIGRMIGCSKKTVLSAKNGLPVQAGAVSKP
jgi:hypothetical protein